MNLYLIVHLFLPFIYAHCCWDIALCFNLSQDITLAEERQNCTYSTEQYALQGSFLSNPSGWHKNKRGVFHRFSQDKNSFSHVPNILPSVQLSSM